MPTGIRFHLLTTSATVVAGRRLKREAVSPTRGDYKVHRCRMILQSKSPSVCPTVKLKAYIR
jgi:hypothetical protein